MSKVSPFKSRDIPLEIETFAATDQSEVADMATEQKAIFPSFVFMVFSVEISCRPSGSHDPVLVRLTQLSIRRQGTPSAQSVYYGNACPHRQTSHAYARTICPTTG